MLHASNYNDICKNKEDLYNLHGSTFRYPIGSSYPKSIANSGSTAKMSGPLSVSSYFSDKHEKRPKENSNKSNKDFEKPRAPNNKKGCSTTPQKLGPEHLSAEKQKDPSKNSNSRAWINT